MKNKTKISIATGALVLGVASIGANTAHATIGSRLTGFFSSVFSRTRGITSGGNTSITKNLTGSNNLKRLVDSVAENTGTVGHDAKGMNASQIVGLNGNNYYHQVTDSNGERRTLYSKNKPKIKHINGPFVTVKYKDINGESKTATTNGAPIWEKGKTIIRKDDEKLRANVAAFYESIKDDVNPNNFDDSSSSSTITSIWAD